ncbi:carbamoyltransferase HypF [Corynebacterium diphtheriae]
MLRTRYLLRGVVQGVGFRPHVAAVAARHRITGLCGNNDLEVFVEAQALSEDILDAFISDVLATLPPLAHVVTVTQSSCPPISHETDFRIVASEHLPGARTLIPPDVATCPDCLADMADPNNRRYRYPFTTCTHCGSRLSIIEDLPYDRPLTTMKHFPMCPQCAKEYSDPHDRRYHAQPISCPDCGPSLWVEATETHGRPPLRLRVDDPIAYCRDAISRGKIVAVKGLGGFHLMCDATNDEAVRTLRERKHRPTKPLAVMIPDVEKAGELARLDADTTAALTDPAHPIVLVPTTSKQRLKLSLLIAPGLDYVGLVLPYTPLHTLLVDSPVVATSANNSGEPLCWDNDVARENLTHLADVFLMHDRPIHIPVEDSVVVPSAHGIVPIRRSRGFAPLPLTIPTFAEAGQPALSTLAVGGELKNTFTLAHEDYAHISSHIGDMGSWPSQQAFHRAVDQMLSMQRTRPDLLVCDLHPSYATTAWAQRYSESNDIPLVQVQHHEAHAMALLAEHRACGTPAVILAADGTGYGHDNTIWGGELLSYHPDTGFERTWHVPTFELVGGDRAVQHPWRIAAGIAHAWDLDWDCGKESSILSHTSAAEIELVESQLSSGFGVVRTSSLGRVFDAAAAIVGIRPPSFEAESAMLFEAAARNCEKRESEATSFPEAFAELLETRNPWTFHHAVAQILQHHIDEAAVGMSTGLTGGCALNQLLSSMLRVDMRHQIVPPNDGGLSLGQAVLGRWTVSTA